MVSVLPSASWLVTVAVSVWPVVGAVGAIVTESTTGAVLAGGVTVQVNVSVSLPLASETVTVTLCVPGRCRRGCR